MPRPPANRHLTNPSSPPNQMCSLGRYAIVRLCVVIVAQPRRPKISSAPRPVRHRLYGLARARPGPTKPLRPAILPAVPPIGAIVLYKRFSGRMLSASRVPVSLPVARIFLSVPSATCCIVSPTIISIIKIRRITVQMIPPSQNGYARYRPLRPPCAAALNPTAAVPLTLPFRDNRINRVACVRSPRGSD